MNVVGNDITNCRTDDVGEARTNGRSRVLWKERRMMSRVVILCEENGFEKEKVISSILREERSLWTTCLPLDLMVEK